MKKDNGKSGALYCAIIAVLLFGFAVFAGCDREKADEEKGGNKMIQKTPLVWNDTTKEQIINDFMEDYNFRIPPGAPEEAFLAVDDVIFLGYYGIYGDCATVKLCFYGAGYMAAPASVNIDGVIFEYAQSGPQIRIWNPDGQLGSTRFCFLPQAYFDLNLVTKEDVLKIHEAYYGGED